MLHRSPLFRLIKLDVLLVIDTGHLTSLEASHSSLIVHVHLLILVWSDYFVGLSDLELIRNGARSNALVLDIVDDILHFLFINVHGVVAGEAEVLATELVLVLGDKAS